MRLVGYRGSACGGTDAVISCEASPPLAMSIRSPSSGVVDFCVEFVPLLYFRLDRLESTLLLLFEIVLRVAVAVAFLLDGVFTLFLPVVEVRFFFYFYYCARLLLVVRCSSTISTCRGEVVALSENSAKKG